jgi:hypothetical protein
MRIHLIRGLVGAVMAILFFWGLGRVPLAQAIALAFISPLISLYLAALLLKERIESRADRRLLARLCRRAHHLRRPGGRRPWPRGLVGIGRDPALGLSVRLQHHPDAPAGAGRAARWRSPSSSAASPQRFI